jgi:hypothetical protein
MKHIKGFKALNEAKEDGLEIMDALVNTPEGKDLVSLICIHKTFSDAFVMKKTGRIHISGAGSKTYIDKFDSFYGYESLSNGKPFGRETFNSITELLRGIWSNIIAKQLIIPIGDKKEVIRSWVESNILPGEKLTVDEIGEKYTVGNNLYLPDLSRIENESKLFKRLNSVFNVSLTKINNRYYTLDFLLDKWGDFSFESKKYPNSAPTRLSVSITAKFNGKSSRKSSVIDQKITLTNSDNIIKDFEKCMKPIIEDIEKYIINWDLSNPVILRFLIKFIIYGDNDTTTDLNMIADEIINKNNYKTINTIKGNYPALWKIIRDKMGDSADLASDMGALGLY